MIASESSQSATATRSEPPGEARRAPPELGTTRSRSHSRSPRVYAVDLGRHDEVVLMQSLDLLGLQGDRCIAPTEADIRMMAFGFRSSPISWTKVSASWKLRNRKLRSMR